MRNKTLSNLFDNLLWGLLYTLPLLVILCYSLKNGTDSYSFIYSLDLNWIINNPFYDILNSVIGSSGVLHLLDSNSISLYYLTYFVTLTFVHVLIDIILWLPRFIHKILEKSLDNNKGGLLND